MYDEHFSGDERRATTERAGPDRTGSIELLAVLDPAGDGARECTLFPAGVDARRLITTWLSAGEGSFVSLAEMR